jgi:DNA polymerase III alpha subunit
LLLRFDLHEFDKAHACGRVRLGLEAAMLRTHDPRDYAAALLQENAGRPRRRREILVDAIAHGVDRAELESVAGESSARVESRRKRRAANQLELVFDPTGFESEADALVEHASLWSPKEARPSSVLQHLAAGAHVRVAGAVLEESSAGRSLAVGQMVLEDPWGSFEVMITPRTHTRGFEHGLQRGSVVVVHGRLDRKRGKVMVVATRVEVATIASEQGILFVGERSAANSGNQRSGVGSRRPNAERRPSRPDIRVPRATGARRGARRAEENSSKLPRFPLLGG